MPPATEPVAIRILDNLRTALGAVAEGADYFHTINVVETGVHLDEVRDFPAVLVGVGDLHC